MPTKWVYEITPAAQRDLKRLPRPIQVNILAKVVALAKDPHASPQVKRLKGSPGRFRLRVADYRVLYLLDEQRRTVRVERVRHRRDVYRGL
jgi:mRNA interferase RelE/StbE